MNTEMSGGKTNYNDQSQSALQTELINYYDKNQVVYEESLQQMQNPQMPGQMQPVVYVNPGQDMLMSGVDIPNNFDFVNKYRIEKYCLCCTKGYESQFVIPSVGNVRWEYLLKCCNCKLLQCLWCSDKLKLYSFRYKTIPDASHLVIEMHGQPNIYFRDQLIGTIEVCKPTCVDLSCGRCNSSFPQVRVKGVGRTAQMFVLAPDTTCIPTLNNNFNCCTMPFACLNFMKHERDLFVYQQSIFGEQNKCLTFKNLRTYSQSIYDSVCCSTLVCCYDSTIWPHYKVNFDAQFNQMDRILVLAGLIHFCMLEQHFSMRI